VAITGWSDARISWPRCHALGRRGGSGLLVDEELARAVRLESSLALQYWFSICEETVWRWRQILGVPKQNPASALLRRALNREDGARLKGKKPPPDQEGRRRPTAGALVQRAEKRWTAEQLALLGTMPDEDLARRTGRTALAIRCQRSRRGIPTATGWAWTAAQVALLGKLPDVELAARSGRTVGAVRRKRNVLGIPSARDRRKPENR
jgi:hypothetical protein